MLNIQVLYKSCPIAVKCVLHLTILNQKKTTLQ